MVTSIDSFMTRGQYKKFLNVRAFFEMLIDMKKSGCMFLIDGDIYETPFIDGVEMGFYFNGDAKGRLLYVGDEYGLNKKTCEFDIPWIGVTMKSLRDEIKVLKVVDVKL